MRPKEIQLIGEELAVKWETGEESYVPLRELRRACPCAVCSGEPDLLGMKRRPPRGALPPEAFRIERIETVGGYALRPIWKDGHDLGIYTFELIRALGERFAGGGGSGP